MSDGLDRVRLLLGTRRWDEAVEALAPTLAQRPDDAEPLCLLAQAHLGAARPGPAVDAARRALVLLPDSPWAHRLHALGLHALGRDQEAVGAARWLVEAEPDAWRSWWLLSLTTRGLGAKHRDEAVDAARRAVALAPDEPEVHDELGSALLAASRPEDAALCFRRALELDPANAYALNGLGRVSLAQKDASGAAAGFRRALSVDPTETAARHNLEVALQQAARPLAVTLWIAAFLLSRVALAEAGSTTVRLAALTAAAVVIAAATVTIRRFLGGLDGPLRAFYLRLVRGDRRLAAGVVLHVVGVVAICAVVVAPRSAAAVLASVAIVAVLAGRLLFFRGGWRRAGRRRVGQRRRR